MTGSDDNLQTTDFEPNDVVARAFRGPRDPALIRVIAAFVLASASHLWLADAAHPDWMVSNITYVIGLILLVFGRGSAAWFTCAIALAIPLLFHRDQLTQSMLLLLVCVVATLALLKRKPDVAALMRTCRGLLIVTYAMAAFHKLNHDFFDPAVGCASYGIVELAEYYNLAADTFLTFQDAHALLAVALEVAIPIAYLLDRRHLARFLAVVFHIPLTMTMAPAFAFVMAVGHAAFLTDDDIATLRSVWRKHRAWMLPAAIAVTTASLAVHGSLPEPTMIPREFVLWLCLFWFAVVLFGGRATAANWRRTTSRLPAIAVAAFTINCFTPYLGIQFQHTAAMLSNLRIDRGCWNHFVVPESVRLTEDYVRVDHVMFARPGVLEDYRQTVLEQLWSPPQFRQMQKNWCRPEIRPFELAGTYRDERWSIADLCDEDEAWPFQHAGVFGVEIFPNFLRFQKNLARECPQACIH